MRVFPFLLLVLILLTPSQLHAGGPITQVLFIQKDQAAAQLSAPYDLRDRKSYIQVSNVTDSPVSIHVQIFQHDRGCVELNFDDELTANDTVVYDLENIIRNNGSEVPINLADDSNGYVVVSDRDLDTTTLTLIDPTLVGNFRIVDEADYEYRANMAGISQFERTLVDLNEVTLQAHFNTVEDAIQADLIGYTYDGSRSSTVRNYAPGITFDIFMYDMAEEPLSCDRRNFACGNIMNYGINEDYPNSKEDNVICPGGGLANPDGGFVDFVNGSVQVATGTPTSDDIVFVYYIGINNGNGTGSMDTWIDPTNPPVLECETSCNDLACNGLFFDGGDMETRAINWTIGNSGTCEPGEEMTCDDMFDNDNDKLVDCEDPDCMDHEPCGPEVCDDGIDNDGDMQTDCDDEDCSSSSNCSCENREFCRVFVTSTRHAVTLGGSGDTICQNLADSSNLTQNGSYLAWISDGLGNSPDSNFMKATVPYQMVDNANTVIASSYIDLINCTNPSCLDNTIIYDETGSIPLNVAIGTFSATATDGTALNDHCNNWTDNTINFSTTLGDTTSTLSSWTSGTGVLCSSFQERHFYCFEQ